MSYCDNCLHRKVCGLENVGDEAMIYCCDKLAGSNDVISRQAALEKAINVPIAKVVTEDKVIYRKIIFADDIEKLPPVTPQMKIGHWILQPSNKDQGERDFIWWKCSECGQVIFSENERDRREFHAFCGRCGAINERKLVEPQERENKE